MLSPAECVQGLFVGAMTLRSCSWGFFILGSCSNRPPVPYHWPPRAIVTVVRSKDARVSGTTEEILTQICAFCLQGNQKLGFYLQNVTHEPPCMIPCCAYVMPAGLSSDDRYPISRVTGVVDDRRREDGHGVSSDRLSILDGTLAPPSWTALFFRRRSGRSIQLGPYMRGAKDQ